MDWPKTYLNIKKKIAITILISLLIVVFFGVALLLLKSLNRIPEFNGRIAYIKKDSLRIRDYSVREDYLLSKKMINPEKIFWSPLGKYLLITQIQNQDRYFSIFDLDNRSEIDINLFCEVDDITEAKWVGKTDVLAIRKDNTFYLCDFNGLKTKYYFEVAEGELIRDWVPLNKDYLMILVSDNENKFSRILRLNFSDKTSSEVANESTGVLGSNEKYLWFADDRNFVYLTPGYVNRILLNENYNPVYKNTVKIVDANEVQPVGWNLDPCVGGGQVFIPQNKFLILEKNKNNKLVKQINFTAPQEYSSFEKDIQLLEGDTYWGLAERIFGDGSKWKELYKYNTKREPTQLQIGTRIHVPAEEIKTFKEYRVIQVGDNEALYIPQLFVLSIENQTFFLTPGFEEEVLVKFSPKRVLFDTKQSLQNEPRKFLVLDDGLLSVYSDIDTKIDNIRAVKNAAWDWSNGYCYNHKYGEVIPSAPDLDLSGKKCTGYMEVRQYRIQFHDVCEEDWNEKIVSGITIMENSNRGIKMSISRMKVSSLPDDLPYSRNDGTKYDYKNLADGKVEYNFYFKWKPKAPIEALKIICEESGSGECEEIVPNFGWMP